MDIQMRRYGKTAKVDIIFKGPGYAGKIASTIHKIKEVGQSKIKGVIEKELKDSKIIK